METLVLYCKSYKNDVLRAKALAESIRKFNTDHIPFYISVPAADMGLFTEQLKGLDCTLLRDEEILATNPRHSMDLMHEMRGGLLQQVVKSEFWRLGISRNYVMIDSDSYFIRPFSLEDFMFDGETPYTVMHEGRDLLDFAARTGKRKIRNNFAKDRLQAKENFKRPGRIYDFGPTPLICSSLVWKRLAEEYAEPANKSLADLIREFPNEMLWYGEAVLHYAPICLMPIEPLFKVYHYKEQYQESLEIGENEKTIAENYLGIIKQSNWDFSLDLVPKKKRTWKSLWMKR
ncbi:MAG TPA: DUF6492 family protein [Desulfuromonadaceae bacterium]